MAGVRGLSEPVSFILQRELRILVMMYRARFSSASSSFGWMRFPQKTWHPECRHVESMEIISLEIFFLAISMQQTLPEK